MAMNELIRFADHIHYNLTKLLLNYHDGKDLSIEQEEILKELFIAREKNYFGYIESIPYKPNIHLKKLDMSGVPGMHKNKIKYPGEISQIKPTLQPNGKYIGGADSFRFDNSLDQTITSIDGIPVPIGHEVCEEIVAIIRGGGDLNSIYTYCQNKLSEKSLTLKDAFKIALLKDRNTKDEIESFNNYELAIKINSGEELSLQDWPKIRSSVGKSWKHIPEILGFCWKYIDGLKVK
jgi:hypothetical protein